MPLEYEPQFQANQLEQSDELTFDQWMEGIGDQSQWLEKPKKSTAPPKPTPPPHNIPKLPAEIAREKAAKKKKFGEKSWREKFHTNLKSIGPKAQPPVDAQAPPPEEPYTMEQALGDYTFDTAANNPHKDSQSFANDLFAAFPEAAADPRFTNPATIEKLFDRQKKISKYLPLARAHIKEAAGEDSSKAAIEAGILDEKGVNLMKEQAGVTPYAKDWLSLIPPEDRPYYLDSLSYAARNEPEHLEQFGMLGERVKRGVESMDEAYDRIRSLFAGEEQNIQKSDAMFKQMAANYARAGVPTEIDLGDGFFDNVGEFAFSATGAAAEMLPPMIAGGGLASGAGKAAVGMGLARPAAQRAVTGLAGTAFWGGMEYPGIYDSVKEAGGNEVTAHVTAAISAPIIGAIENLQVSQLGKWTAGKPVKEVVERKVSKLVKEYASEYGKELSEEALQSLTGRIAVQAAAQFDKEMELEEGTFFDGFGEEMAEAAKGLLVLQMPGGIRRGIQEAVKPSSSKQTGIEFAAKSREQAEKWIDSAPSEEVSRNQFKKDLPEELTDAGRTAKERAQFREGVQEALDIHYALDAKEQQPSEPETPAEQVLSAEAVPNQEVQEGTGEDRQGDGEVQAEGQGLAEPAQAETPVLETGTDGVRTGDERVTSPLSPEYQSGDTGGVSQAPVVRGPLYTEEYVVPGQEALWEESLTPQVEETISQLKEGDIWESQDARYRVRKRSGRNAGKGLVLEVINDQGESVGDQVVLPTDKPLTTYAKNVIARGVLTSREEMKQVTDLPLSREEMKQVTGMSDEEIDASFDAYGENTFGLMGLEEGTFQDILGDVEFFEGEGTESSLKQIEEAVAEFVGPEMEKVDKGGSSEAKFFGKVWSNAMKKTRTKLGLTRKAKGFKGGKINEAGKVLAVQEAMKDVDQYVKDNPRLLNYYHEEVEAERGLLDKRFGEMDDTTYDFYRLANGLASASTQLEGNTRESIDAWENFKKNNDRWEVSVQRRMFKPVVATNNSGDIIDLGDDTGKRTDGIIDEDGRRLVGKNNDVVVSGVVQEGEKYEEWYDAKPGEWIKGGAEFTIHGGAQVQGAENYLSLNRLLNEFGDDQGAIMDYLREETTWAEIDAFREKYLERGAYSTGAKKMILDNIYHAIGEEAAVDGKIPRVFAYGPKIGAYALNRLGDDRYITVDVWDSRFWRSYFGDTPWKSTALGLENNAKIRGLFIEAGHLMAKELGVSPSAAQAIRWFYMIKKAKEAGYGKSTTDSSIAQYTERFLESDAAKERSRLDEAARLESEASQKISHVSSREEAADTGEGKPKRGKGIARSDTKEQGTLFQREGAVVRGAVEKVGGRWRVWVNKDTNFSTLIHEFAHILRTELSKLSPQERPITESQLRAIEKWVGVKNGKWTREAEETWAKGLEEFFRTGRAPLARLKPAFKKIRDFMAAVYQAVGPGKLPKNIRKIFNDIIKKNASVPSRFIRDDGKVLVVHYSPNLNGEVESIDPKKAVKFRKGHSRNEFAALEKPRTFFYLDNSQKESMVHGSQYTALVDFKKIYNLNKDLGNLKGDKDLAAYVDAVEAAGYEGVYYKTGGIDLVSMFTPVEAKKTKGNISGWVNSKAEELVKKMREDGGFTFDPRKGEYVGTGYSVADRKDTEFKVPLDKLTKEHIIRYAGTQLDRLDDGNMLGGWVSDGYAWFDSPQVIKDENKARKIGKKANQEAMFNLDTFEEINLREDVEPSIVESRPANTKDIQTEPPAVSKEADTGGDPVSARRVINGILKRFNLTMKEGYMGRSPAAAHWNTHNENIRAGTKDVYNLAVVVHEVAHSIDQKYGITGKLGNQLTPSRESAISGNAEVMAELELNDYDKGLVAQGKGRDFEGFAEFLRRYMTGETTIAKGEFGEEYVEVPSMPATSKWFSEWLDGPGRDKLSKQIEETRQESHKWRDQGIYQRIRAAFAGFDGAAERSINDLPYEMWKPVRNMWDSLITTIIDDLHPLHGFVRIAKKNFMRMKERQGYDRKAQVAAWESYKRKVLLGDPYTLAMVMRYSAPAHAQRAIENGVHRMSGKGETIGPSVAEIMESLEEGEEAKFSMYAFMKRVEEIRSSTVGGKSMAGYQAGEVTDSDIKEFFRTLTADEIKRFDKAALKMTEYYNALLDAKVDVGLVTPEAAEFWKGKYKYYVPMTRVATDKQARAAKKLFGVHDMTGKLTAKGSSLPVADPLSSLATRTLTDYTLMANKVVENSIVKLARDVPGMAQIIKVQPKLKPSTVQLNDLLKQLVEKNVMDEDWARLIRDADKVLNKGAGPVIKKRLAEYLQIDPDSRYTVWESAISDAGIPNGEDIFTTFKEDYRDDPKNKVVRVMEPDGTYQLYQIDKLVYETLVGDDGTPPGRIGRIVAAINDVFKTTTVGMNPTFMATNYIRDFSASAIRPTESGEVQGFGSTVAGQAKASGAAIKAGASELGKAFGMSGFEKSDVFTLFEMMGGDMYNYMEDVQKKPHLAGKQLTKHGLRKKGLGGKIWGATKYTFALSDVPPRLSAFEFSLKSNQEQGGYKILKNGKVEGEIPMWALIEANMAGQEASINFKRRGTLTGRWNKYVPFLNATVQGNYAKFLALKRAGTNKDAAMRMASGLATLGFATIMNVYARQWDDEEKERYQELADWQRRRNWNFLAGGGFFSIPKPREYTAFINTIELAAERFLVEKPDADFDDLLNHLENELWEIAPPIGSGPGLAIVESFFDWNFFRNQNINSYQLKKKFPQERYDDYTSEVGKVIGRNVTGPLLGVGPKRVDHLLSGTVASWFQMYRAGEDLAMGRGFKWPEAPVVRGVYRMHKGGKSDSEFYDKKEELEMTKESWPDKWTEEQESEFVMYKDISGLMKTMRDLEKATNGGRRDHTLSDHITGLSRFAMGKEPAKAYPNVLAMTPQEVREISPELAVAVAEYKDKLELPEWSPKTGRWKGAPDPTSKAYQGPEGPAKYKNKVERFEQRMADKKRQIKLIEKERELRNDRK